MNTIIKVYDEAEVKPYDKQRDPAGYIRINNHTAILGERYTSPEVQMLSAADMVNFVRDEVIAQFERNITKLGGNTLLYRLMPNSHVTDYTKPVREGAAQILFHISADHICRKSNILVNREPQVGNGAVDFSIGQGYSNKAIVEIKKSNNKNLIDGYDKQVAEYVEREAAATAFFVVVVVKEVNVTNDNSQLNRLQTIHAERISNNLPTPHLVIIDALEQTSPSQLRG
jgi:hypothetical protein